jgi:hypothetical protein
MTELTKHTKPLRDILEQVALMDGTPENSTEITLKRPSASPYKSNVQRSFMLSRPSARARCPNLGTSGPGPKLPPWYWGRDPR